MLLLPFDIAVRRLVVTRTDLMRLRQALFGRVQVEATSERMSTLLDAKQRARTRTDESSSPSTGSSAESRREVPSESPKAEQRPSQPVTTITPKDPGNVAGELLKKRKERK